MNIIFSWQLKKIKYSNIYIWKNMWKLYWETTLQWLHCNKILSILNALFIHCGLVFSMQNIYFWLAFKLVHSFIHFVQMYTIFQKCGVSIIFYYYFINLEPINTFI